MADLLVRLYALPENSAPAPKGVAIKRAIAPEKGAALSWIAARFSRRWASEADVAFSHAPPAIFVAVKNRKIIGFACYDAAARGFFGPIGVDAEIRSAGLGKALLLRTLEAMREAGYAYAIIGWAGPVDFFKKTVGATVIRGSAPGIYKNLIK